MNNLSLKEMTAGKNIVLSLQHLLAMYAGAVVVPIIIANAWGLSAAHTTYMVAADIVICGITTFLQLYRGQFIGSGLPVVMASTFTGVGPMVKIGTEFSPATAFGSVFVAGIFMLLLAPVFAKLNRLFPPLVSGIVVMLIGITLMPVAITNLAGGDGNEAFGDLKFLGVGLLTFLIILLIYRFTEGFVQSIATLIGLVVGTVIASFFEMVDLEAVARASWLQIPMPFAISSFHFEMGSILNMIIVGLVTFIEVTGNYFGLLEKDEKISEAELKKGYRSASIGYLLAGLFNTTPQTAFSQNLGVIKMSGVRKREIIVNLVLLMLLIGLIPKLGVVATAIPAPVLGGAMIFLFGNVFAYGVSVLGAQGLSNEDMMIIAAAVALGLGVTVMPEAFAQLPSWIAWITNSGIVAGSTLAVILNLFLNGISEK